MNSNSERECALTRREAEIAAFSELVHFHQASLRAFVRALGVQADCVDDIAQEVFVIAFQKRAEFEQTRDFGRWIRGIARNIVANERRKSARRNRILNEAVTDSLLGTDQESLAEPTPIPDVITALNDCVAQLPEHSRALLHRRYETGQNSSLLAEVFQQSAEAIRQNLSRIRQVVKRCIEEKIGQAWL